MAIHPLNDQFRATYSNIGLGSRRKVAIAAHLEVRSVLRAAGELVSRGLDDVLIGSYPRRTGIWPGKDVDVFGKLTAESIDSITPSVAYELFLDVLCLGFRDRIEPQARSIKVNYRPDRAPARSFIVEAAKLLNDSDALEPRDTFEFSVDVVPAVRFEGCWGIPNRDRTTWQRQASSERWVRTDPEKLTDLTQKLNKKVAIVGQGAYVPTVKAIRQIRRAHLGDAKPGGLYMELIVHEGFTLGAITGGYWADLTASTLAYLADRLVSASTTPVCDPSLGQPYSPPPDATALAHAATTFGRLASRAATALTADKCPAAAIWREIFGSNTKVGGPVFDLPAGCASDGSVMPVFGATTTNPLRGTNEARGFGCG